ncbi:hypothetical protein ACFE04_031305 [Oxalis oulophora]
MRGRFAVADMDDPGNVGLTSIAHLPDDCLSFIFQRLDCYSDHESFGLTCHRWLNIQNVNRRSLQFLCTSSGQSSFSQSSMSISSLHLFKLLTRFQNLDFLSVSGCTELSDSGLHYLKSYGSKVQALYMDFCFKISDDGLFTVSTSCPLLMDISLSRCDVTDSGLEILAKANLPLKRVNLSYCSRISDIGLKALCNSCRGLKAVKLSYCSRVTGIGFRECSPTLSFIDAESCNLYPAGIMEIVSGGGLEYLNVSGSDWSAHRAGLRGIGIGFASSLKVLNLRACKRLDDRSIAAIAKECPLLVEWNLASCHDVGISGWESIGLHCHKLAKLHVNRCRQLCDDGLRALREGCKGLLVLYMFRNNRISFVAIQMFKLHRGDVEIKHEDRMCIGPDWKSI